MKTILAIALLALVGSEARADEYVNGHYRANGKYVEGYYRTRADSTPTNNYSYQGNTNPYHTNTNSFGTDMGSQQPSYNQYGR